MILLVLIGLAVIAVGFAAMAFYVRDKLRDKVIKAAVSYGWLPATVDDLYLYVPPSLAGKGDMANFDFPFDVQLDQTDAKVFVYTYIEEEVYVDTQGREQVSQKSHTFTILSFAQPEANSQVHIHFHDELLGLDKELGYDGWQHLELEGDFNKCFEVFVPEGQQQTALEVLEPDVLVGIMDKGRGFDMDIYDGQIAIIGKGNHISAEGIPVLVGYAKFLLETID